MNTNRPSPTTADGQASGRTPDQPDRPGDQQWTEVVKHPDALEARLTHWQRLSEMASEPNAFYEPWGLLPALRLLNTNERVEALLIWAEARNGPKQNVLCGLFPVQRGKMNKQGLWRHAYLFDTTPLVRSDALKVTIRTWLDWIAEQGMSSFRLPQLHGDGRLARAFWEEVQRRELPYLLQRQVYRAMFRPADNAEAFLRRAMSTRTRKSAQRLRRRLHDCGEVRVQQLSATCDPEPWIEDFLALEADGWKGRAGTALGNQQASREFFRSLILGAHRSQRLLMLRLTCDEIPVAMNTAFLGADGGHYFKIAYAEQFARFTPGRILELAFIEHLHERGDVRWLDSCAKPNHDMIDHLWDERRTIQNVWLGQRSVAGHLRLGALSGIYYAKDAWQHWRTRGKT